VITSGVNLTGKNFANFNPLHDQTATVGFWANNNGQSLINSFGKTSSGLTLANWLATTFPKLFGSGAPAYSVSSVTGMNLANRSNADIYSYFVRIKDAQGGNVYAQVLGSALAIFTTTNSLNTGATSRSLASKFGFILSNSGTGAINFTVPQSDWSAFGITSSSSAKKTILQLLQIANNSTVSGKLNGGNTTLVNQVNEVFSTINVRGDIVG
jgi:hypothetical protein